MSPIIIRVLGLAGMIGVPVLFWWGTRWLERLPEPPQRLEEPSDEPGWLLLPFQAVGLLAGLSWAAIALAVFLAPLALLVLWAVVR